MFDENGKEQREVWTIEPPKEIKKSNYYCDKKFHLEFIEDLYHNYDDYGVLSIMGESSEFYLLNGTSLTKIGQLKVDLPSNHDQGGQSQNRIARQREEKILEYLKKVDQKLLTKFLDSNYQLTIQGLIIVGNAHKKDQLTKILDPRLRKILLGVITADSLKLEDLLALVHQKELEKNQKEWEKIENYLRDDPDRLIFGKEIAKELVQGLVSKIVLTETFLDKNPEGAKKFLKNCQDFNVQITKIPKYDPIYHQLLNYNQIVGIKWY